MQAYTLQDGSVQHVRNINVGGRRRGQESAVYILVQAHRRMLVARECFPPCKPTIEVEKT